MLQSLWREENLIYGRIEDTLAKVLYDINIPLSITRLERYASCAYAHFLQYGLKLEPRKEWEVQAADMGNLLHSALEFYFQTMKEKEYNWKSFTEQEKETLLQSCLDHALQDNILSDQVDDARNRYIVRSLKRILTRSIWALSEQIKKGLFVPKAFEVQFHLNFDLAEREVALALQGRIDRVDTYEEDERTFLKVVDYKSGKMSFDLSDLYDGLELQLVVYLDAAIQKEQQEHSKQKVIPAAMFYYSLQDPLLETEEEVTLIEDIRLKKLMPNGLVNDDEKIISCLDGDLKKDSLVIPVSKSEKTGQFSSRSSLAAGKQFQDLITHVRLKIQDMGKEMFAGDVSLNPCQKGQKKACDFCPFSSICGIEEKKDAYRKLKQHSKEEIWEKLKK
ncbi:hypothetical protein FACS189418_9230 [Clostridia bacterium]|nr:hypothetical protein FACS189418_9230 [Clostridia bacterium]